MRSFVSENINRAINERGLKQKFVAEKAGYSFSTFNQICNGRRKITDVDIIKICVALNLEPNELFACDLTLPQPQTDKQDRG